MKGKIKDTKEQTADKRRQQILEEMGIMKPLHTLWQRCVCSGCVEYKVMLKIISKTAGLLEKVHKNDLQDQANEIFSELEEIRNREIASPEELDQQETDYQELKKKWKGD